MIVNNKIYVKCFLRFVSSVFVAVMIFSICGSSVVAFQFGSGNDGNIPVSGINLGSGSGSSADHRVLITTNGPGSSDVMIDADDVHLIDFTVIAGVALDGVTFKNFDISLTPSSLDATSDEAGLLDVSGVSNFTDIKIVNTETGETVMGSVDVASFKTVDEGSITIDTTTDGDLSAYLFTDEFSMGGGEVLHLALTADVADNVDLYDETLVAKLELDGMYPQVEDINNKSLVNANVLMVPVLIGGVETLELTGKTMTVKAPSLTVSLASDLLQGGTEVVSGSNDVQFVGFTFSCGKASDCEVNDITLQGYVDADGGNDSYVAGGDGDVYLNFSVGSVWLADDGGDEVGAAMSVEMDGTVNFTDLNLKISAGESETVYVTGDVSSNAETGANIAFGIPSIDYVVAEDEVGNPIVNVVANGDLNNGSTTASGKIVYVDVLRSGSLSARWASDTPDDEIVFPGATDKEISKFTFEAESEDFVVKELAIKSFLSPDEPFGTYEDNYASIVLSYVNSDGEVKKYTGTLTNGIAQFAGMDMFVERDVGATLTVSANLNNEKIADLGDYVGLALSPDNFEAVGVASGMTFETFLVRTDPSLDAMKFLHNMMVYEGVYLEINDMWLDNVSSVNEGPDVYRFLNFVFEVENTGNAAFDPNEADPLNPDDDKYEYPWGGGVYCENDVGDVVSEPVFGDGVIYNGSVSTMGASLPYLRTSDGYYLFENGPVFACVVTALDGGYSNVQSNYESSYYEFDLYENEDSGLGVANFRKLGEERQISIDELLKTQGLQLVSLVEGGQFDYGQAIDVDYVGGEGENVEILLLNSDITNEDLGPDATPGAIGDYYVGDIAYISDLSDGGHFLWDGKTITNNLSGEVEEVVPGDYKILILPVDEEGYVLYSEIENVDGQWKNISGTISISDISETVEVKGWSLVKYEVYFYTDYELKDGESYYAGCEDGPNHQPGVGVFAISGESPVIVEGLKPGVTYHSCQMGAINSSGDISKHSKKHFEFTTLPFLPNLTIKAPKFVKAKVGQPVEVSVDVINNGLVDAVGNIPVDDGNMSVSYRVVGDNPPVEVDSLVGGFLYFSPLGVDQFKSLSLDTEKQIGDMVLTDWIKFSEPGVYKIEFYVDKPWNPYYPVGYVDEIDENDNKVVVDVYVKPSDLLPSEKNYVWDDVRRYVVASSLGGHGQANGSIIDVNVGYDKDGVAYVVYEYYYDFTSQIVYVKGNGWSWSSPEVIYVLDDSSGRFMSDLKVQVDGDGNVHVAWSESGVDDRSADSCYGSNNSSEVYYTYLNSVTGEWADVQNLSNNDTPSYDVDISVDDDGNLSIVWVDGGKYFVDGDLGAEWICSREGGVQIYSRTKVQGEDWSGLKKSGMDDQFLWYPQVALSGIDEHITYTLGSYGLDYTYTGFSDGDTWLVPYTLYDGPVGDYKLVTGHSGTIHLLIKTYDEYPSSIDATSKLVYLYFNGKSWGFPEEVFTTDFDVKSIDLVVDEYNNPEIFYVSFDGYDSQSFPFSFLYWIDKTSDGWTEPELLSTGSDVGWDNAGGNESYDVAYNPLYKELVLIWKSYSYTGWGDLLNFMKADANYAVIEEEPPYESDEVEPDDPLDITDEFIDASKLLSENEDGTKSVVLHDIFVDVTGVSLDIPSGITITGPSNWDGKIGLPTFQSVSTVNPDGTVSKVIEVGFSGSMLTFDRGVALTIPGEAGKEVGYVKYGSFAPITTVCSANTQEVGDALPAGGDCKIDVGSDLVIWTKHFTEFVTYTKTVVSTGENTGGGGGGGGSPIHLNAKKKAKTMKEEEVVELQSLEIAEPFTDISGHWAESFIEELRLMGVVSGKVNGKFEPDAYLTRAELVKIVVNLFKIDLGGEVAESPFTDVLVTDWYAPYVMAAKGKGVVVGYSDGTFKPNQQVSRVEALKILIEASGQSVSDVSVEDFVDVPKGEWYAKYVAFAKSRDIVAGYEGKTFRPLDFITRGEVSKVAIMLSDLVVSD